MHILTSIIVSVFAIQSFAGLLTVRNMHSLKTVTHNANQTSRAATSTTSSSVVESKQAPTGSPLDLSILTAFTGGASGLNSMIRTNNCWIGSDGDYTNEFTNASPSVIYLVIWGPFGSWVNVIQPLITVGLSSGETQNISFASGASGAWAAVYPDTVMSMGQISQTWGEYTFGLYSTVDVSREVNMNGQSMSIKTPNCVSDMETCVFKCLGGVSTCLTGFELANCATDSQPGADFGTSLDAPSGGCSDIPVGSKLQTIFS